MMKLIVVEAHKSNYPDPIHFQKGDRLMIAKRDTEFKGWIWVTTKDGNQGWAPVQYLQIIDERKAVAKQNYTAVELDTCAGDELLLHNEVGRPMVPVSTFHARCVFELYPVTRLS